MTVQTTLEIWSSERRVRLARWMVVRSGDEEGGGEAPSEREEAKSQRMKLHSEMAVWAKRRKSEGWDKSGSWNKVGLLPAADEEFSRSR
mmetsp:Transcript_7928/g.17109  ORF Transcript_7928/g.17109 Transcript_7928/m.17109 type:complete len:89 (-) Transcript_7928:367-633(-)